jgi:hypothetical protein
MNYPWYQVFLISLFILLFFWDLRVLVVNAWRSKYNDAAFRRFGYNAIGVAIWFVAILSTSWGNR